MAIFGSAKTDEEAKRKEYYDRLKLDMDRLTKEANGLVQFVKDAQPERLAEFKKSWDADQALWTFRAERWGDFLSVSMAQLGRKWDEATGRHADKQIKSQFSIRLDPGIVIRIQEGHAPDMEGRQNFGWRWSGTSNADYKRILTFSGVLLPTEKDMQGSYFSSGDNYNVPVFVEGIARTQESDRIIIGAGGGTAWDDMMNNLPRNGFGPSYNAEQEAIWKRPRDGATVVVPATLGQQTYRQILEAMKASD